MGEIKDKKDFRELLKRSLVRIGDLEAKLAELEGSSHEPIAVVGIGCRFPGGVDGPDSYWQLLKEGRDAISEVLRERWGERLEADDPQGMRWGGFVTGVDGFDARFFEISPREASALDPQQRLVLEIAWEALERAGLPPDQLRGSRTGIFLAASTHDYHQRLAGGDLRELGAYVVTGNVNCFLAGRLAYFLGAQGPALTLDTACSGSLVAVHLACQSLRAGHSDLALAGGVNLILSARTAREIAHTQALAPDGRCKSFDARANGFVRGEGCGIIVLKRLADARAAGAPILALIRGSAVNQDGRSSGLTAPNVLSQESLIRQALADAQVSPAEITAIEAHGTGTSLGDPIEVEALKEVFGELAAEGRIALGSVKTNLGHLEAAAGIAGLIKMVLALDHQAVPRHLHFETLNPRISLAGTPLVIAARELPWPRGAAPRLAGVSSFGLSGTNAHAVLEEAPVRDLPASERERPWHLLTLSAKSAEALRAQAARYAEYLAGVDGASLGDLCFTAATGRTHFEHRLAVVAGAAEPLRQTLAGFAAGNAPPGCLHGRRRRGGRPRIALLFTGQGSQYAGMGRGLYTAQPVFREALERCAELLKGRLERPLLSILYPGEGESSPIDETAYTQPALFALEYALAELWRSWGIVPDAVLGHSVGEYAAACVAGVLRLEDALALVTERARLMSEQMAGGEMATVAAGPERVSEALAAGGGEVSIAAVNGAESTVIAGTPEALRAVVEPLAAAGIRVERLAVSHAFHSPLVEPILEPFARRAAGMEHAPPRCSWISGLTGRPFAPDRFPDATYWCRQTREPVRFHDGMQALLEQGCEVFVEVGPNPALLALGRRLAAADEMLWLPSLRRRRQDWEQILSSLGALYVRGVAVDWAGFDRPYPRRKRVLPTYPFQRQRFWIEPPAGAGREPAGTPAAAGEEDIGDWFYEIRWRAQPPESEAPDELGDPAAIAQRLGAGLETALASPEMRSYRRFHPQLEALSTAYIVQAFAELGWEPAAGELVVTAELADRLQVAAGRQRLLGRLLGTLEEDGFLSAEGSGWRVIFPPAVTAQPRQMGSQLRRAFPAGEPELVMVERCGQGLAAVLRSDSDPLELLFPGGELADAERIYEDSVTQRVMNALVRDALATALEALPAQRKVRILELGAGTGGTTAAVLPRLPAERTEYTFTDVSPQFLAHARRKFQAFPYLEYRLLDAEADPAAQGFAGRRFDFVVAANVLHATSDLRRTLGRVRQLLAPGGLLVLLEGTGRQRWVDLFAGLTDGWWKYSDTDLRPSHPLLSPGKWRRLLEEEGFTGAVALPEAAEEEGIFFRQALILARGPQRPAGADPAPPGLWVILADQGGIGERLAEYLKAAGDRCALAVCGSSRGIGTAGTYRIEPDRPEDYLRLLREVQEREALPCRGLLHLGSLDATAPEQTTLASLGSDQELGCRSALYALQALIKASITPRPRLWLVTRGAQPVAEQPAALAASQSPLWGLGKVIALEHPEIWGGLADLGPEGDERDLASLVRDLRAGPGEDRLAYRGAERYVARLVRSRPPAPPTPPALRSDATYLIAGGLGGVGMSTAQWMVAHGARHLVLISRRGAVGTAADRVRELRAAGAEVRVAKADLSRRPDMMRLFDEIATSMPPLGGVIHSAMLYNDKLLAEHTWERFTEVMAPKVAGTWILHELTRELPLDFFVLFSSAASLVGISGLGNYAAANAFQDAFAHFRRALGLPALSINWGGWQGVGTAGELGERREQQWQTHGMHTFDAEQGLQALAAWLSRDRAQVGVVRIDWARYLEQFVHPGETRYLSELQVASPAPAARGDDAPAALRQQLREAPPGERRELLEEQIRRLAARVLGIDPRQPIDPQQPLSELGLDSLMAVELRNHLGKAVEATLPATVLFDHPSTEALSIYLGREVLGLEISAPAVPSPCPASAAPAATAAREAIAVIGMACRFPAGAEAPEHFWELLRSGEEAMTEIPAGRWDVDAYHDPDPDAPGKAYARVGAFLRDAEHFDAEFFGIAPREARSMDPKQRLLLEVAWEALERAGQPPERLAGTPTGVFFGIYPSEYSQLVRDAEGEDGIDAYFISGNAQSIAAGRLSYLLGLEGPSLAIDTACSSSLVAVHLACQSLRAGECGLALAGGVHLMLSPQMHVGLCKLRMLAPDGRCKAFDAAADGFVRGEGCGVVVLERLADAVAHAHPVLAVIRGSAVNQDGRSSGMTAPNGPSQQAVIRQALAAAGIASAEIGYVEAHGTGTSLGDPIEAGALIAALGEGRGADDRLIVGAVKTNIGHLEAAAGVAGLIKAVLALEHGEIPPNRHFEKLNPHVTPPAFPFVVPTRSTPWPAGKRRFAGVSAFGFGGTNAHVVLEEAPPPPHPATCARPFHLLALAAKSAPALEVLVERYDAHLANHPDQELADVAFSANTGRNHFAHRLAVVADSPVAARRRLAAARAGQAAPGVARGCAEDPAPPKLAFLFTGQGSQYCGMGRQLYDTQPTFRRVLERCDEILRPHLDRPLLAVLYPEAGEDSPLDQTAYAQPALFALEYALAELWRSWGIVPAAVFGHSVGEYVAACVAGVLELADALELVARRGRLMQELPAGGEMAVVFAGEDDLAEALAAHRGRVAIAAVNGPRNTVLSGPREVLASILGELGAAGFRTRPLNVSHAFHSPLVEPMLAALEASAAEHVHQAPRLPIAADVDGELHRETDFFSPAYWRRQARQPVHFHAAVRTLMAAGYRHFLEIGPEPALAAMARGFLGREDGVWMASLRRKRQDWEQLLDALAALYARGARVDWAGFDRDDPRRRVLLPTYPFARQRYWVAGGPPGPRVDGGGHPLIGRRLRSPLRELQFESHLAADRPAFLNDHRVYGVPLVPAAAYFEMALAGAGELLGEGSLVLEEVVIQEPMALADSQGRTVQLILEPDGDAGATFRIVSSAEDREDAAWTVHAAGALHAGAGEELSDRPPVDELRRRCGEELEVDELYRNLRARGIEHGESFRTVEQVWRGDGEVLGRIRLPAALSREAERFRSHPVVLDACLQILPLVFPAATRDLTYLPFRLERLHLLRPLPPAVWSHARLRNGERVAASALAGDVRLYDDRGELVAELGLEVRKASREALLRAGRERPDGWLYQVRWRHRELPARQKPFSPPDPAAIAAVLEERLPALIAEHGLGIYEQLTPQLDALSFAYAARGLRQLGWSHPPGRQLTVDSLAAELGIAAAHRRLLGRLLEILAEEGIVRGHDGGWQVTAALPEADPRPAVRDLGERYPAGEAQLDLLERCGEELAALLAGRSSPLDLLFPGGELSVVEKLYLHSPLTRTLNTLAQQALGEALRELGAEDAVRILEVGAGSGGTTALLLPQLPAERTEYVFTDVSPLFLSRAEETFAAYPFVSYRTLDLELDPREQGFAAHGFDVVVAANVVHATSDLRATLGRIRELLAPGGMLLLIEMTAPERWVDLTFGLTDGWWKFTDTALRPAYPLLARSRWPEVLREVGFVDPVAIPEGDEFDRPLSMQGLFLCRAPARPRRWVIVADRGGVAERLADAFEARGEEATVVGEQPETIPGRLQQALAATPPCRGVVYLGALDATSPAATTVATLAADQALVCGGALRVVQALGEHGGPAPPRLWLVTRGAQAVGGESRDPAVAQAPLWGLAKTVALEHPQLRCTCVDLDPAAPAGEADELVAELSSRSRETQVAWRGGRRRVARLTRFTADAEIATADGRPHFLEMPAHGLLEQLRFQPLERRAPQGGEVEIEVRATGLNFRDVLCALGTYPGESARLGGECAGIVVAVGEGVDDLAVGQRVAGMARGAFASFVTTPADLIAAIPEQLSFEAAATIPAAYLTAYYALHHLAGLGAGQRVLIHAATGGVGMAAVALARRAGAEIFATAGNPRKREFLRASGIEHVFDSRTLEFADEIRRRTGGRGVDVVLNSLAGEFVARSFSALAEGGCFLEIGRRDVWDESRAAQKRPDARYFLIALDDVAGRDGKLIGGMLRQLMREVGAGELEPLPQRCFPSAEVIAAFRTMQQARHIGKIVVTHPQVGCAEAAAPARSAPLRPDRTYLITGGLKGLGLLVAEWMVEHGVRHLLLAGRRQPSAEAAATLDEMRRRGAEVRVEQADVSRPEDVRRLLAAVGESLPPLAGVVHSAGVLDDGVLLEQNDERFRTVMAPKVDGGWLLHTATAAQPLELFVLFSSLASMLGSPGQGNHAAANAFLDALAAYRRHRGLPAQSINWGVWSEVGAAAERDVGSRIRERGGGVIAPQQGLELFAQLLRDDPVQVGVQPIDWSRYVQRFPAGLAPPFLSELAVRPREVAGKTPPPAEGFADQLRRAPAARRRRLLRARIEQEARKVLGIEAEHPLNPHQPMIDLGLDSLMAVELRNALGMLTGVTLPATLLFDHPTLAAVSDHLAGSVLHLEPPAPPAPGAEPESATAAMAREVAGLSKENLLDLLAAELGAEESP